MNETFTVTAFMELTGINSMTRKAGEIALLSSDKKATKLMQKRGLLVDLFNLFYPRLHPTSNPSAEKMNKYILLCPLSIFLM